VIQFGRLLATIQREAWHRLNELVPAFSGCTFFESLRIEPYYRYTASQVPEAAAFIHALIVETVTRHITFVHGDYSPKNILVYQDHLVLLDYEIAHIGDPAFDVGFSMTHLLSKAHHLPQQRADFAHAANVYWQTYHDALGDLPWRGEIEPRAVRHTLACLLARVAGRSPLEYMLAEERARQRGVVVSLVAENAHIPTTMADLIERFTAALG
jgi:hypothetical protein